jgi:hypothetical protein
MIAFFAPVPILFIDGGGSPPLFPCTGHQITLQGEKFAVS